MTPTQFLILMALIYLAPHIPEKLAVLIGCLLLLLGAISGLIGALK
jgi:DNA-binding MarR family transcriptional regulator